MGNKFPAIALLLIFTLLGLTGILHHEIWLDEAQNWLQARDNDSVSDLLKSLRYEGHPILWNLLLFFITRFTHNVLWMQILHLFIIVSAVAIFIWNVPFPFLQKALFVFGYFIFFEYAEIARNYSLIVLFLFIIASVYSTNRRNYFILGILLAILANTHLLGYLLSLPIALKLLLDFCGNKNRKNELVRFVSGGIIFVIANIACIIQVIPPGDTPVLSSGNEVDIFSRVAPVFLKAFVPIPDVFNYNFWNTNLIISISKPLAAVISFALSLLPVLFLRNKRIWMFLFYMGAFSIVCFCCIIKLPAVRYAGIIYIFFIFCIWLVSTEDKEYLARISSASIIRNNVLSVLLIAQLIAGVIAYSFDFTRQFSESKEVATYLKHENLISLDILGEFCESSPILCYIDEQAYYLDLKKKGSYCHLKEGQEVYFVDINVMLAEAVRYVDIRKQDALFIHHEKLTDDQLHIGNFSLIKSFNRSVVNNENFYVYRVSCVP